MDITPEMKSPGAGSGPPTESHLGLPRIPKGKRLTGLAAEAFARDVERAYLVHRATIREICSATGRSHCTIHRILKLCNVKMRRPARRKSDEAV
ncbi:helix-turn-helix domain-containing protein [Streptomyces sp. NBC_00987]|uniref:helix-turn-helix domain-containing protein n=2 Tax=unclassified Streptomyces TaxID=2593676 RepID=UPI00386AC3FA|nr:helix-turn-helix domain-containing protein [Streptomyces sp. NBC_00987]